MPLVDVPVSADGIVPASDVRAFLVEAERRVERFQRDHLVPGFVASDFSRAYAVLHALSETMAAPGKLFCEWGSGLGVVACLAAMLDYDAFGIEIDAGLVDAARRLAGDFDLPVEFACGSFLPEETVAALDPRQEFAWLDTEKSGDGEPLELGPADFDVVFAYPWPDEEQVIEGAFERHAAVGAVLVSYHGGEDFRVRRKVRRQRKRA